MGQIRFVKSSSVCSLISLLLAFSLNAWAAKGKVIYSFQGGTDGENPVADLVMDAAGNLYGTTFGGGAGTCGNVTCGTVFELVHAASGWQHKVLYRFQGKNDGGWPKAGVIFDNLGNLYGTATLGGKYGAGVVYKLTSNSKGEWSETVLHSFNPFDGNGTAPANDLVFDNDHNLYGTTTAGVNGCTPNGCGSVFELTPQADGSWTETTLHSFLGNGGKPPDGQTPSSGLTIDSDGNLYGVTIYGGTGACKPNISNGWPLGCGTIYELSRSNSWTEAIFYNFERGGGFGVYPGGGMILDKNGDLIGMATEGGNGGGTIFKLRHGQGKWSLSDLHIFYGNPDGWAPVGNLVRNESGVFFGVTVAGPSGEGLVFQLDFQKGSWKLMPIHTFGGKKDGVNPQSGLLVTQNGNLYGTTENGGAANLSECAVGSYVGCGTVYEVEP